jgi:hypothetical protein
MAQDSSTWLLLISWETHAVTGDTPDELIVEFLTPVCSIHGAIEESMVR